MIGHQTIGQHPHGIPEGGLGNDLNERVVIAMLVKDLGAGITVQDVVLPRQQRRSYTNPKRERGIRGVSLAGASG